MRRINYTIFSGNSTRHETVFTDRKKAKECILKAAHTFLSY